MPTPEQLVKTATSCHALLHAQNIPHVIIGGLAVCLHGYERNARDIDLLIRMVDEPKLKSVLQAAGYTYHRNIKAFKTPGENRVRIDFRHPERDIEVIKLALPDPSVTQTSVTIMALPILALHHLIENKLACSMAEDIKPREREKHRTDVIGLIGAKKLTDAYSQELDCLVRAQFCELVHGMDPSTMKTDNGEEADTTT